MPLLFGAFSHRREAGPIRDFLSVKKKKKKKKKKKEMPTSQGQGGKESAATGELIILKQILRVHATQQPSLGNLDSGAYAQQPRAVRLCALTVSCLRKSQEKREKVPHHHGVVMHMPPVGLYRERSLTAPCRQEVGGPGRGVTTTGHYW